MITMHKVSYDEHSLPLFKVAGVLELMDVNNLFKIIKHRDEYVCIEIINYETQM
jgi:hypothetical protein